MAKNTYTVYVYEGMKSTVAGDFAVTDLQGVLRIYESVQPDDIVAAGVGTGTYGTWTGVAGGGSKVPPVTTGAGSIPYGGGGGAAPHGYGVGVGGGGGGSVPRLKETAAFKMWSHYTVSEHLDVRDFKTK